MRDTLVLTILGPDRVGLVEALADRIAAAGGNWEASHMARLAGQFAGILQVTVERDRVEPLLAALRAADGVEVLVRATQPPETAEGSRVALELTGDDRAGIIRDVTRELARHGVNVEELESEVTSAPMSGEPLFRARAVLHVPDRLALSDLRAALESIAGELMVDLTTSTSR